MAMVSLAGHGRLTVPADPDIAEYKVKAAFLYHFTQLVEWPTNAFVTATTPMTIGILGQDPFGNELEETLAGKTVAGRSYVVARFQHVQDSSACHVLFVSNSEARRLSEILEGLSGQPVLTVGEADNFATQGGVIGLVKRDERIQIEINPGAASQARLRVSSRLLRLASLVPPAGTANPKSADQGQTAKP